MPSRTASRSLVREPAQTVKAPIRHSLLQPDRNIRASRALTREWITPYSIGASAPVNSRRMIFIGTNPEDNNPS